MGKRLKPERSRLMLDTPMSRLIPKMAVPTIIAQIITTIYNLADTYFVSSLGTSATAAVGVNASIERIITLLGSLIGMGASTYVARLLGAKRKKDADTVLSTSFLTAFGLGIIILTVGLIIKEPLVMFLGATEDCKQYSIQYIQYVLLAVPFLISSFVMNMSLRSEGSATYSMIGIGFGGILNIALDPLFIFGLNLGVAGASMATAISKFVSFSILLTPYLRRRTAVSISIKNFKYKLEDIIKVITVGSTSFFRSVFNVIALIIINRIAGTFSTAALAAISVANRVMDFPFHIILGFTQGFQPVAGYNWGAKRYDRVRESLRFSLIVGIVGAFIMAAIIFCGAVPIMKLFNKEANAEVLRLGRLCLRIQCAFLVVHAGTATVNQYFAGIGKAGYSLLMSTARQGYCLIPLLFILPEIFGVRGLCACQGVADLLTLIPGIPLAIKAFKVTREAEAAMQKAEQP